MLEKLRACVRRPSPATGIALLALFVALGGTGYAAAKLARNSVGTAQLKNNAVTGAKVKNGSLTAGDFGGTLPSGATGPKGDAGAPGGKGDKGDKGDAGTNGTNGTAGANGTNGTNGTNGANGAALVAHALCSGCTVSSNNNVVNVPLTGDTTWTQAAGDAAQVDVRVTWQPSISCTTGQGSQVSILDNGSQIGSFPFLAAPVGPQTSEKSIHLFPPNATSHVLTVTVGDNCTGGGASEHPTVTDVKIDAVQFVAP